MPSSFSPSVYWFLGYLKPYEPPKLLPNFTIYSIDSFLQLNPSKGSESLKVPVFSWCSWWDCFNSKRITFYKKKTTLPKTNMTMENPPWMSRCISYRKWWIFQCHVSELRGVCIWIYECFRNFGMLRLRVFLKSGAESPRLDLVGFFEIDGNHKPPPKNLWQSFLLQKGDLGNLLIK